jgi:signal transduction histidine kinase
LQRLERHLRAVSIYAAGASAMSLFTASHAQALTLPPVDTITISGYALAACLAVACIAALRSRSRAKRAAQTAQARLGKVELYLNEAEAALKSDPHLLLTWRGTDELPERLTGSMQGTVTVPVTIELFMRFQQWLEPDSAAMLKEGLQTLKQSGEGFNFGIKTQEGDLLDADGRAAGGLATLRVRPLAGERQKITELTYDARKLAKQVERLSAVLDRAPYPIWLTDKDNALQWVNQAYVRATEAQGIEDVLRNNIRIAKDGDIERNAAAGSAELTNGFVGRVTTVLSGSKRTLDIYEVVQNATSAGFAIDVTDVADAGKELERHVNAHNSTLNRMDTAIAIFGPDQRLSFYNSAYVKLWSLDEKWLGSKPSDTEILDTLRGRRNLPEQVNYREWRDKQLEIYTNLEPQEAYWYLPDGRSLKVVSEQHPFGGITYLYENLTKEFQLESRYNELFGVQRETLDNLAEAVSLFGSDGRLKLFNPAFAKFWSLASQFLGDQPHIDTLAQVPTLGGDARAAWLEIRYAVTTVEDHKVIEGQLVHAGYVLRYRSVPLPDGNSLVTFTDISGAARAEQALRERADALETADRIKTDFLQNISYEIRTPLTSIVGFAETLVYGLAGPMTPRQSDYVRNIHESSGDLKAIIDGIIDLSTIDAGAMELHVESVDVEKLMELVAEKASAQLTRRQLSVNIEIGTEAGIMMGDPQRLEQIFSHLLSNAIGFSPQAGTVRMGARRVRDRIQLWVADQGKGMDPDFKDKAFERFSSKPLPGSHRGAGLGLAVVKSFTELHGGTVTLASKLQEGTTVVCELPVNGPLRSLPDSKASKPQAA